MAKIPDVYRNNIYPEFPPRKLQPDIDPDDEEVEELTPKDQRAKILEELMKRSPKGPS